MESGRGPDEKGWHLANVYGWSGSFEMIVDGENAEGV